MRSKAEVIALRRAITNRLDGSEAEDNLVLIQTSLLLLCKDADNAD